MRHISAARHLADICLTTAFAVTLALFGGLAGASFGGAAAAAGAPAPVNWALHVTVSPEGGHIIGNPDAKVKLVEFMSYTCPHCAEFEAKGVSALRLGPIARGTLSLEIRHLVRDGADVTAAQLTNCVPPRRFMQLHEYVLAHQREWLARARPHSPEDEARQESQSQAERMRAIASELGFYPILAAHGLDRVAVDRCLADQALTKRILDQHQQADTLGIPGTPGFLLDGKFLDNTYDWEALSAVLRPKL